MSSRCPICQAEVTARRPENPAFPFCSVRCRTVDLGRWIGGAYSIPVRDEAPTEEDLAAVVRRPS
ncbi:MAG: DNA gyrase inhibitor YacG [Polyangiales bacterium]